MNTKNTDERFHPYARIAELEKRVRRLKRALKKTNDMMRTLELASDKPSIEVSNQWCRNNELILEAKP